MIIDFRSLVTSKFICEVNLYLKVAGLFKFSNDFKKTN
jgi:hypothetical protein